MGSRVASEPSSLLERVGEAVLELLLRTEVSRNVTGNVQKCLLTGT